VDVFIVTLIALNVIALVVGTVQPVRDRLPGLFPAFEAVSVAIFAVEYVLRVWSAPANPRFAAPVRGRVRYVFTPLALIDLLAIAPAFLPFVGVDLRVMRAARLFRIFRLAKLARYSRALQLFGRVISSKKEELITSLMLLMLLLLIAASLLYFAEHRDQPEVFGSIPAAMWWAAATITTVGYGDVYPVTAVGRLLAAMVAILGLGMFAIPTGLLGAGFIEEIAKRKRPGAMLCPHCGRPVEIPQLTGSVLRAAGEGGDTGTA
jgi:voltage-gated potassium channel